MRRGTQQVSGRLQMFGMAVTGCPSDALLGGEPAATSPTVQPRAWLRSTRSHGSRGSWSSFPRLSFPFEADGLVETEWMLQHSILPSWHEGGSWTLNWNPAPQTESLMCFVIKWEEETHSMASSLTEYPDFKVLAQTTEF